MKSEMHKGASKKIFEFAKELHNTMTASEQKLWNVLKDKPLGYKFRRQHPFSTYILDFYCHKAKLSIEIDGGYHIYPEQKKYDQARTDLINEYGIKELRYTDSDVLNNLDSVLEEIYNYLDSKALLAP